MHGKYLQFIKSKNMLSHLRSESIDTASRPFFLKGEVEAQKLTGGCLRHIHISLTNSRSNNLYPAVILVVNVMGENHTSEKASKMKFLVMQIFNC